jgi:cell division protein FtsB
VPNVVRGSKQEKMVVVPHRPWRHLFLTLVLISGAGASIFVGLYYSYNGTVATRKAVRLAEEGLNRELLEVRARNTELEREVAILERSSVMDRQANKEVQGSIQELREKVVRLEEDIVYYRQVVSDETESSGLVIDQLNIRATFQPDRFHYKLVMRHQDTGGDIYLSGHVNVNLVGKLEGEQVVIPIRELSVDEDQLDIKLRFRLFQNIEGELALPEGFDPEQVHIAAISTSPANKSINKKFSWVVAGD